MLLWLVELANTIQVFNLFRYITFRTGAALFTSATIVFLFGPMIISSLRIRQGKGQPIRADGPQTHFKKAGTPTMGGLMILAGIVGSALLWADLSNVYVVATLLVTLGFGAIGFYDDYLKVTKQTEKGFSGKARLGIEFLIAGIAVLGDMLEMGAFSPAVHAELASPLLAAGIEHVWLAGGEMAALCDALPESVSVEYRPTTGELADYVTGAVAPGDVVMVKSSLGLGFGKIVSALLDKYPAFPDTERQI